MPGAVLLSEALRAIESGAGADLSACRVKHAKFLAPVRPGDRVTIEYSDAGDGAVRFSCSVLGKAVLRGEVTWGARRSKT